MVDIDTGNQQYIKWVNALQGINTWIEPNCKKFAKLTREEQLAWLNADPLLKAVMKFAKKYMYYVDQFVEEEID